MVLSFPCLGDSGFQMNEMVHVAREKLVGEVIGLNSEKTTIQVYEETSGIKPGETVTGTGAPVSVTLAPGILSNIFDGIEASLKRDCQGKRILYQQRHIRQQSGHRIKVGYPHGGEGRGQNHARHHYC